VEEETDYLLFTKIMGKWAYYTRRNKKIHIEQLKEQLLGDKWADDVIIMSTEEILNGHVSFKNETIESKS